MSCQRRGRGSRLAAGHARQPDRRRSRTTRGRTSPISCTATASAGATTSRRAPSPTARTTRCSARPCRRTRETPGIWNPLPWFDTVRQTTSSRNIQPLGALLRGRCKHGTLPAVSWIVPGDKDSEHPPALITNGQTYVTGLINTIMRRARLELDGDLPLPGTTGAASTTTSRRPTVDGQGYGLRVPGLVISPYAKQGYIDHQILSFDAYLKFIEDDFLRGGGSTPRPTAGPTRARRPRERQDPRQPRQRLQLQPEAAAAADPPAPPAVSLTAGERRYVRWKYSA